MLPSQPSRPVWSSALHFGGLGSRWLGTSGSSGWVSVGSWRVGTEINQWWLCEDWPVPGFTAAFRENPGLDGPSFGKMEAAEGVFWLALQSARHLTTAHAHSHLTNGHLGKAAPEKSGWGGCWSRVRLQREGMTLERGYLGLLGCLSAGHLLTEEVALGQKAFIE